jgi:hypothetical protein
LVKKKGDSKIESHFLAEREGFEPPEPLSSTVFKTAAIDHSAISPKYFWAAFAIYLWSQVKTLSSLLTTVAKIEQFFYLPSNDNGFLLFFL